MGEPKGRTGDQPGAPKPVSHLKPKYIAVSRNQGVFYATAIDRLAPENHLICMFWTTVQGLDLKGFEAGIGSRVELQGAPCWDPRASITVPIYGYAIGVGAGRALARMLTWDPADRNRFRRAN